jgi:hypothetical protein
MVNYQDPVTIAQDYSACFPRLGGLGLDLAVGLFNSGACETLARHEWYIYVSLPQLACRASLQALLDHSTVTLRF